MRVKSISVLLLYVWPPGWLHELLFKSLEQASDSEMGLWSCLPGRRLPFAGFALPLIYLWKVFDQKLSPSSLALLLSSLNPYNYYIGLITSTKHDDTVLLLAARGEDDGERAITFNCQVNILWVILSILLKLHSLLPLATQQQLSSVSERVSHRVAKIQLLPSSLSSRLMGPLYTHKIIKFAPKAGRAEQRT